MSIYTDANDEFIVNITEWCKNNKIDLSEYELKPDHRNFFGNQFMSDKDKKMQSEKMKKLILEGKHNFQLNPNPSHKERNRKKSSERMKGNNYGSLRKMTEQLKNKLSEKSKGNTNVRGTKWWTNGVINKRSKECPGKEFKLGFMPCKEETKRKISEKMRKK